MFRARVLFAACLLIALGPPILQSDSASANTDDASCFQNSATGANFVSVCLSSHGNISRFDAGSHKFFRPDSDHEGYALCSDNGATVHGWDAGKDESPWGDTSSDSGPIITRRTSDGLLKLTQSYSFNFSEGEIVITMAVKNVGNSSLPKVLLSRYFSADLDVPVNPITATQASGFTSASAFAWYPATPGLMLTALNRNVTHKVIVENAFDWSFSPKTMEGCVSGGPADNDKFVAGRVTYILGTLDPGDKKTVTFKYERL